MISMIPNRDANGNIVVYAAPFADKKTTDGKKLFKRLHGQIVALSSGSNTVNFTVPYGHAKMIGARITNGEVGDYCDFKIKDDASGTYSTVPNATLNQYGYNVAITKDNHEETCNYDADLYYGMVIEFTYNSVSSKSVGFNYNLSEVVTP